MLGRVGEAKPNVLESCGHIFVCVWIIFKSEQAGHMGLSYMGSAEPSSSRPARATWSDPVSKLMSAGDVVQRWSAGLGC